MADELSIDEWLQHQPNSGKGKYLSKWKKNKPPEVKVWLHCSTGIQPLWRHNWPKLVELDKDGDKEEHIWSGDFNCWEEDKLLTKQYKRDRQTDERNHPPKICPLCIFLETLRTKVNEGEIDWLDPIFVFDAADDDEETILYAAPLYNGIPKDLEDDEKDELKKAGIRRTETWKQNGMAKCNYVFRVVDDGNPGDGVQIAIEGTLLGEKMKDEIGKEIKRRGAKKGHPIRNPYPFLWENHKEESQIQKRFAATALTEEELRDDVRNLIENEEPPSIEGTCKPGDVALLRSVMEEHISEDLVDVFDWDQIFAKAEKMAEKMEDESDEDQDDDEPAESERKPKAKKAKKAKPAAKSKPRRRRKPEPEPEPEPEGPKPYEGEDGIECEEDGCGFMMGPDWEECPKCGAEYDVDEDEDEDEDEDADGDQDDGDQDDDEDEDEAPESEPEPEPEPPPKKKAKSKAKPRAKASKKKAKAKSKASARGKGRGRAARPSNGGEDKDPLAAFVLPGSEDPKDPSEVFGQDDIPF